MRNQLGIASRIRGKEEDSVNITGRRVRIANNGSGLKDKIGTVLAQEGDGTFLVKIKGWVGGHGLGKNEWYFVRSDFKLHPRKKKKVSR